MTKIDPISNLVNEVVPLPHPMEAGTYCMSCGDREAFIAIKQGGNVRSVSRFCRPCWSEVRRQVAAINRGER